MWTTEIISTDQYKKAFSQSQGQILATFTVSKECCGIADIAMEMKIQEKPDRTIEYSTPI